MIRFFDFIFSLIAIIVLFPFMVPIVIILLLTGEHYVFYRQIRIGRNGKEFGLFKFATMLKNSPNMGTGDVTMKNDPRVLPIGGFLRKTKINEIPQLLNILFGQMSIVGPRPMTPRNFNIYTKEEQNIISKMRPGLTGIGSIIFRDEETIFEKLNMPLEESLKTVVMPYKAQLEKWYFENQSVCTYFKIIFATAWVVIFPSSEIHNKWFKNLPINERIEEIKKN